MRVDDSGNIESPAAGVSVTVAGAECPCTLWASSAVPGQIEEADPNSVELGVKFRSDVDGLITGIRFYKGPNNTGTHVGSLWTGAGELLAQATFTGETASGWQQVDLATPVAITANTIYVASYHAPNGFYSGEDLYFANSGVDRGVLHAPQDGVSGPNGVYSYSGTPTFPSSTYRSENYWVDVVFETEAGQTNVAPAVTNPGTQSVAEGALLSLPIVASDAQGQVLTYALDAPVPAGMTIGATTGVLTWTPADGPVTESVTVRVTDDGALSSTVTFDVNVTNVAPTLTLSGAASSVTGQTYTLTLAVSDPGADTLTGWTIDWGDGTTPEPVAGSASSATHVYGTAAAVTISASATDEDGSYAAGNTVAVTVSAANVAPAVTNPGTQSVAEGALLSLPIVASDAQGQVLTYALDARCRRG